MAFDIMETLRLLAVRRPVFHSEADFQHALAWMIHERRPSSKIRLEYRPSEISHKTYVDIWIEYQEEICAIELKYKTRKLNLTIAAEPFSLLDQGAQDTGRYDFCKDIERIEALTQAYHRLHGYAVFLTNDQGYWQKSGRNGSCDAAFRIHDSGKLCGRLEWAKHASDGTIKGRTRAISLIGDYPLNWIPYSKDDGQKNAEFRMIVAAIAPAKHESAKGMNLLPMGQI